MVGFGSDLLGQLPMRSCQAMTGRLQKLAESAFASEERGILREDLLETWTYTFWLLLGRATQASLGKHLDFWSHLRSFGRPGNHALYLLEKQIALNYSEF